MCNEKTTVSITIKVKVVIPEVVPQELVYANTKLKYPKSRGSTVGKCVLTINEV